ncbi:MAG: ZIP family metal transporter [Candidatus Pacebacteria bacterium]|nr:ZIP family metal transporter [Candidatus Paceibacterota bacterium]
MLSYIILATVLESLVSLTGIFLIFLGYEKFKKHLSKFLSFAAGTFLAVIFFEILPEAVEKSSIENVSIYILIGFLFFFLFSRFLHWYHHHEEDDSCCKKEERNFKSAGYLVLAGDFIHNFIDGIIIALAFASGIEIGIVTTIAVLAHEFPQEASDFFVLVNSGFSTSKALLTNFLVSLSTILGATMTFFAVSQVEKIIAPALGIVAGNFLYIAMSDLIPELNSKTRKTGDTAKQFVLIILGVLTIFIIGTFVSE